MNKKAIVLCILIILLWAYTDVGIWGRMLDRNWRLFIPVFGGLPEAQDWFSKYYHWAWADLLRGMILIGAVALMPHWRSIVWFIPVTWLLANSGIEDLLYYLMQGYMIPARLEWLDGKYWAFAPVTPLVIAASILIHAIAAIGLWLILDKVRLPNVRILLQRPVTN